MTLKQLEVFLAVADTHSFSKGGEAVSLAQSTASQHIRALEDELGVRLFDRSATAVSLTEVGRLFHEHATLICRQCAEAKEAIRRFQGLLQATLRVGASTIPAACLIPDLLGGFSECYPGIRLEVRQGDSSEMLRDVLEEQVELAVVGGKFSTEQLEFQTVGEEEIVLVTKPAYKKSDSVSIEQLTRLPLIMREQGSGTRQAVDAALLKHGIDSRKLPVIAELGSSEGMRRALLSGAGWAFISSLAVARELAENQLATVQVEGVTIKRSFYLAQRQGRTLSPAAVAFSTLLKTKI
jgi:DNA-binding transcriptional LysR family regulator